MAEYLKHGWPETYHRSPEVVETVSRILGDVEREGLPAIRRYSEQLDGWSPESFVVPTEQIEKAAANMDDTLAGHLDFAREQVAAFARRQRATLTDLEVETHPGIVLGHKHIPVGSVGSYAPGGRYPLIASSIMTVTVPKVAGVGRVVAAAPPRDATGIYPAQLYTMHLCGADVILCIGGVQALAALAFGVEDVSGVDMVVGAGNAYVAEAKRQLFGTVGIDLLAGPTEVAVIADDSADPRLVAADLLGQAEHGPNSPALLMTTSRGFGEAVLGQVRDWLEGDWPTGRGRGGGMVGGENAAVAGAAWRDYGTVVVCADRDEVVAVSDRYAPEHLELQTDQDDWYAENLTCYGSLFIGPQSTVAYSDKAIGTNHVLPTGRAGRYTGGLWVGKFLKTLTYQRVSRTGSELVAPPTAAIADAELMFGHALTARLRIT